jgi:ABC-type antimicrobial peptide transport system permease subunit
MAERVHDSTAQVRFYAVVLSLFAIVALVLACVGVSGVVAYDVSRREREVGIRCALGARPAQILWLFGRRALRLIGVGIVVGWALALGGSRALRSVLFGVEVMDPVVFTLVPLLLLTIAVAATLVPAGRAARLHPGRALSSE